MNWYYYNFANHMLYSDRCSSAAMHLPVSMAVGRTKSI